VYLKRFGSWFNQ